MVTDIFKAPMTKSDCKHIFEVMAKLLAK